MKFPSFQFYPNDWLGSETVRMMTPAMRGAYIHLLCTSWLSNDCGLPDDPARLAVLSGLGDDWEKLGCSAATFCYVADPSRATGRVYHPRQLRDRIALESYHDAKRVAGSKGGKAKQANRLRKVAPLDSCYDSASSERVAKSSSSPSSSSSFSDIKNPPTPQGDVKEEIDLTGELVDKDAKRKIASIHQDRFDLFWSYWPKCQWKTGKADALREWLKIKPDAELTERIIRAIHAQQESRKWQVDGGDWIPKPAKWLKGGCWEDPIETQSDRNAANGAHVAQGESVF